MAPANSLRTLVIDDDPGVVNALTRLLSRDGYLVHTASNGYEALALLHEYGYNLILCDLRLPELDGRDFYALLLRWYPFLHQRVIFLTGDTLSIESMTFLEQCGQPWVSKPCNAAEVRSAIEQVLHDAEPCS
jgi:CheY-like chemotaxis protein